MSLLTKNFRCTAVDPDGKQFDDVSRIKATTDEGDYELVLDYNCFIYEIKQDQLFQLNISTQLHSDEASRAEEHWHPSIVENSTLAASYEYIMHGKVYNYEEQPETNRATVYVSYGGLLMSLTGDRNTIAGIQRGKEVYLLISRKSK
ncbi:RNA polymerase Rpb8 family protein [Trichomonas vaginalis G3]|uniref:DNA-directed RNA polymerases I, II, and III subunit RPABC3 n=1 Tax=Trichomonas vaginalis (strain ATCC PRA-98 / G3) TaxID=412133 RepID=A2D8U6_TRIV3|nr:transcription by RNA polymerase I [Trichomonas vaginalis G3]EAY23345.1 RNA polymerase Rpb8 family protein [Trichomonas vaginalis G3]KAI5533806.1 transcription by RNA polymerase I [Trichomonas vaginalis G3]|eukprot:XP_001584331.1 RNA polymerase Rpb8 family protein [Trichomonas vaginalis G3]